MSPILGFVVGLAAEAKLAAQCGGMVRVGGGTPSGAGVGTVELIRAGVEGVVSFGLAGGLDPALRPGTVVVPSFVMSEGEKLPVDTALAELFGGVTGHTVLAWPRVVEDAAAKKKLFADTAAHIVDIESGAMARIAQAYKVPFVAVRAVCDPAERSLPPAALVALEGDGKIDVRNVVRSALRQPKQVPGLIWLASDANRARQALIQAAEAFRARARQSFTSSAKS